MELQLQLVGDLLRCDVARVKVTAKSVGGLLLGQVQAAQTRSAA